MSKRLSWLDKFAEEEAKKMNKIASLQKKADQVIVDPDEVPGATDGTEITYNGLTYKVVDANYKDEVGSGIVLEKIAAVEDEVPAEKCEVCGNEPCTCEAPVAEIAPVAPIATPVTKKVTDAPEMARTNPGDIYHMEVRDTVEVQKFEGEAAETASNIAAEDAIDGTTPAGKVNRILQRMQAPVAVPIEAPVVEETPATEETPVEEAPVAEEVPTEDSEEKKEDLKSAMANNRIFKKIIATLK
jgi:hypothetical protein